MYLTSDPTTALQEVNAVYAIPHGPSIAVPAAPFTVCQVNCVLGDVLDLTVPAAATALGTSMQELTGEWRYTMGIGGTPPTHVLAAAAHASGRIAAIRARSVKNVGTGTILAVFPDRMRAGHYLEIVDHTGALTQRIP